MTKDRQDLVCLEGGLSPTGGGDPNVRPAKAADRRPILCLDFDGVIHSYSSGWKGADQILDPPVEGALTFIKRATAHFRIAIYSSRSHQEGGIGAMQRWLRNWYWRDLHWSNNETRSFVLDEIMWPSYKPSAFLSIGDRALTFDGTWPAVAPLLEFRPWNKR